MNCTNCGYPVPADNWDLHRIHCLRYWYFCDICKIPVKKADKITHESTSHITCKCGFIGSSSDVHMLKCKWCSIDYCPKSTHERECGIKLIPCEKCKLNVCRKILLTTHSKICPKEPEECSKCGGMIARDVLSKHKDNCKVGVIPCTFCDSSFDNYTLLDVHICENHTELLF